MPLTQGKVAIVDAADYDLVMQWKWHARFDRPTGKWYAGRSVRTGKGKFSPKQTIYMHRLIMDAAKGVEVDHVDGDGLNNCRSTNLRLGTHQQNACNRGAQRNNSSGYKGVYRCGAKWLAKIKTNQQQQHIGVFVTAEDAAKAYQEAARKMHGKFANF